MKTNNFLKNTVVSAFALSVAFGGAMTTVNPVYAADASHCADLGANFKQDSEFNGTSETYTPEEGKEVTAVFIKQGNEGDNDKGCYGPYTTSGTYEVKGQNVTITFNEDGSATISTDDSENISHVEYTVSDVEVEDPIDDPEDPTDDPEDPTDPTGDPTDPTDEPEEPTEESTPDPEAGKHSSMGKNGPDCDDNDIEVTYDVKENGQGKEGVEVTFTYKGEEKKAKTNSDGRAKVNFAYNGSDSITAKATDGYPDQAVFIEEKACEDVNMDPAKESTPDNGQVLGATTVLGDTGVFTDGIMLLVRMTLGFASGAVAYLYSIKAKMTA